MIIVKLSLTTVNMNKDQNNILFSVLWDLEIFGSPNWESTELTSIGKGLLNVPYNVWLMLCLIKIYNLLNSFH